MGLLRRLAGFLGFPKDDGHEVKDEVEDDLGPDSHRVESHLHRKGFSVPVQVPVERPQLGPVLVPCIVGDGGVQVHPKVNLTDNTIHNLKELHAKDLGYMLNCVIDTSSINIA
ncbi:hypothetical protein HYC85_001330 [Camellia sinensis]|uniref:Uncharacterized protein n=1 Tax=Camellia sinensis TaxID=4442 RepID=A0A7J7I6E7_CAMSI|nr:hypothetical protein HYC85_001330 [Camellia sinensis]